MSLKPAKYSSDIFVKAELKRFSDSQALEEFESHRNNPPTPLSSKIEEYMLRISNSNEFCFNIIIQLLTHGKVRVDFRDSTERLQLVNKQDIMPRLEAVMVFDHWLAENRARPESLESTRKLVLESPKTTLPLGT
jgi:hypothetical protein